MTEIKLTNDDIHNALRNNELIPYLHQIRKDNEIVGAEILCRWDSKKFNEILSPFYFLEQINNSFELSREFSSYMYANLLSSFSYLNERGYDGYLSFNLSASDLSDQSILPAYIMAKTPKELMDKVHLEVTSQHSVLGINYDVSERRVRALKEAGFIIDVDDMGTARGFNMFDLVKDVVSGVKIDKTFTDTIADVEGNERQKPVSSIKGLINAISSMVDRELDFVLEGVEEGPRGAKQLEVLNREGLEFLGIQGYVYGRPIPKEEFIGIYTELKKN
jgi:sensor c-di-GMP phosphodiesterase-like protein